MKKLNNGPNCIKIGEKIEMISKKSEIRGKLIPFLQSQHLSRRKIIFRKFDDLQYLKYTLLDSVTATAPKTTSILLGRSYTRRKNLFFRLFSRCVWRSWILRKPTQHRQVSTMSRPGCARFAAEMSHWLPYPRPASMTHFPLRRVKTGDVMSPKLFTTAL